MSNTEQYSAETYVDVLVQLVEAPASARRDEHYVSVLGAFRVTYPEAFRTFLGMASSSSKQ